jgi:acyl-CoA thioesterase
MASGEHEGEYIAEVNDGWSALGGMPNGGYVLALCTEALRREMPQPDPLVVAAFFMRPAAPGPAILRTDVARRGRRHATGSVALFQQEKEVVRATATFTDLSTITGRTLVLNDRPDLPPPDDCVDALGGQALPGVSITERIEYRSAEIPGWMHGKPTGQPHSEFWMRFNDARPIDTLALVALVDAAAPAVIQLGEGSSTVELTVHVRALPTPGPWVACRARTRHVIAGYHEEDFEIWDAAGQLVAQSRQLALLPGD